MDWVIRTHPNPTKACAHMCRPFVGRIFQLGNELPVPAHPNCKCGYKRLDADDPRIPADRKPTKINWYEEEDPKTVHRWVVYVAWLLRMLLPIPFILIPLIEAAIKYNKERKDKKETPNPPPLPKNERVSNQVEFMNDLVRLNIYSPLSGTVDRSKHIIYGASAMQAVEALGHKAIVDQKTLSQLVSIANGKPKGVKTRFTHPGLSNKGLGRFLGRFHNLRIVGNKAIGDLHLSPSAASSPHGNLRDYIEELAIEDSDAFGMSAVIQASKIWILPGGAEIDAKKTRGRPNNASTKLPVFRIKDVRAIDAVDEPAANRDGVFSAALEGTNQLAVSIFAELDAITTYLDPAFLIDELHRLLNGETLHNFDLAALLKRTLSATDQDDEKAVTFAAQYLLHRRHKPSPMFKETIRAHPRLSASSFSFQPIKLKASKNGTREYHGRLIKAGFTRNILNEKTNLLVTPEAIQSAVNGGQFEGLACFVDHVAPGANPSIRNLLGSWHSSSFSSTTQAATATLTAYVTDDTKPIIDRLDQMLDAGVPSPDVGVSLVFYPEWKQSTTGERHVESFRQIESADIVFFPAADGRILEALSALTPKVSALRQMEVPMSDNVQTAEKEKAVTTVNPAKEKIESFTAELDHLAEEQKGREELSAQWADEIAQQGIQTILKNSNLPDPIKERLARTRYNSPQELYAAIKEAREELQALDAEEVIDLGERPWIYVKDPQDNLQSHVDWFFGVHDAVVPPSNYRRLDQLYVALTGDLNFHGVFNPERVMLASANTTTLANMAVDAMNKVVAAQMSHLHFWRWYEQVAMPIPNDGSVQDMKFITWGGVGNLPTVSEGAAYTELTVDDEKETAAFAKKGGYVGITLEMIRNSAIVQIQAVPRALATAAVRTRSAAVSALFTANAGVGPTMATDATALFHADHGNIGTTALSQAEWRVIRAECFEHSEVNSSKSLAVFPKFCIVPAELYDAALVIFGYGDGMPTSYTPEAQSRGMIDPRPIPLVVPDWTDANNYAYLVDPQVYPVIQISYAQGPGGGSHPAPELYSVTDENQGLIFTNDVMPIKVRDWFAVGVNGPRGIGKRNVA